MRTRSRGGMQFPIAIMLGFVPFAKTAYDGWKTNGFQGLSTEAIKAMTGYDQEGKTFSFGNMSKGLIPIVAGLMAHKVIGSMFGLNRALSRARVPFIRI